MITGREKLHIKRVIEKIVDSDRIREAFINDGRFDRSFIKRTMTDMIFSALSQISEKRLKNKISAIDIEEALYRRFDAKNYIAVPNVYWGLNIGYEVDMFVCNKKSRICGEVEIKISKSDILADKRKKHTHDDPFIARIWYAVPVELEKFALENIPEEAGLFVIERVASRHIISSITEVRKPRTRKKYEKLSDMNYEKLLELAVFRLQKKTKEFVLCKRDK